MKQHKVVRKFKPSLNKIEIHIKDDDNKPYFPPAVFYIKEQQGERSKGHEVSGHKASMFFSDGWVDQKGNSVSGYLYYVPKDPEKKENKLSIDFRNRDININKEWAASFTEAEGDAGYPESTVANSYAVLYLCGWDVGGWFDQKGNRIHGYIFYI